MHDDISILKRTVGSLTYKNPLIFGGGTCKIIEDVAKATSTDAGGTEIGTITKNERPGNEGPHNFHTVYVGGVILATLNSLGMPNPGKEYWTKYAKEAIQRAHDVGQNIGINITGDTPEEIIDMVLWAIELGFDWVTINGGCPNKYDGSGKPKGTLAFDDLDVEKLVELLDCQVKGAPSEIWWKPSPHTDTVTALQRSVRIIAQSNVITGYIANNTVPHCFAWNTDGKQAISYGNGRAGMGGPAVKFITAGHLAMIDELLPPRIARIASGGIMYYGDVIDHLRSRASLIHITSIVWVNNMNYGVVNPLLSDLMDHPALEEVLALHTR